MRSEEWGSMKSRGSEGTGSRDVSVSKEGEVRG